MPLCVSKKPVKKYKAEFNKMLKQFDEHLGQTEGHEDGENSHIDQIAKVIVNDKKLSVLISNEEFVEECKKIITKNLNKVNILNQNENSWSSNEQKKYTSILKKYDLGNKLESISEGKVDYEHAYKGKSGQSR